MTKSVVSVIKSTPGLVLADIEKLMEQAAFSRHLPKESVTILKDNISWHFPYLSANTTPWQLEGVIKALIKAGYPEIVAVHNNTVVTNPYQGGTLNRLAPVYRRYGIQELYNFLPKT